MKVTIEWVERKQRYMDIEVDSMEELSHLKTLKGKDYFDLLGTGKEDWLKLEDNSIKIRKERNCKRSKPIWKY